MTHPDPIPAPRPIDPGPDTGDGPDERTGHPEVERALADLEAALPTLPLAQHQARLAEVLDVLDGVLDRARKPDPSG